MFYGQGLEDLDDMKTPKPAHWILHQTGNVTQHQFIDSEMFHPSLQSKRQLAVCTVAL
jgi:hypothetical protein